MCRIPPFQREGDDIRIGEVGEIEGSDHVGVEGARTGTGGAKAESYASPATQSSCVLVEAFRRGEV